MIILVIVIFLALLFGAQTNGLAPDEDKYNLSKAKRDIESISTNLELFKAENYYYPTTDEGLDALLNNSNPEKYKNWRQYLGKYPLDPWGESYKYRYPGFNGEFDLFTYGPDQIQSKDDIVYWQLTD